MKELVYNPICDLNPVSQIALPTLGEILSSGIVPADAGELLYNDVDNPSDVLGLLRDNFDIADAQRVFGASPSNPPLSEGGTASAVGGAAEGVSPTA